MTGRKTSLRRGEYGIATVMPSVFVVKLLVDISNEKKLRNRLLLT